MDTGLLSPGDVIVFEVEVRSVFTAIERLLVRWGHASIWVGNGDVVESTGRGALRVGLRDHYAGRPVAIMRHGIPWKAQAAAFQAVKYSRDPKAKYDYVDYLRAVVPRVVCQKMGVRLWRLWRRNNRYVCSELVLQCFQEVGVDLGCTPLGQIALPGDFVNSPALTCVYRGKV